jgi:hypothetical protein
MNLIYFHNLRGLFTPISPRCFIMSSLVLAMISCTKNSSTPSSTGGTGALLTKMVIVGKSASGVTVDSVVNQYQWNASNQLTGTVQTMTTQDSGFVYNSSLTYNFTYSGNLISSLVGTYVQSYSFGALTQSATTQIGTTFYASGNQIVSYLQIASTSGTGSFPSTTINSNDSATLTYDASGNVSSYNIYQIPQGYNSYVPVSQQTFGFSGGNLVENSNIISVVGVPVDTVTTTFQYNSKLSAAPFSYIPGVPINSTNDLIQSTMTETGINPSSTISSYQTTYNQANQPVTSVVTLTNNPPNQILVTENISYFYQ